MYLYLFEIFSKVEMVDEKTAHNYLRHPSKSQQANLKYLGAILESERTKIIREVSKEKFDKFGGIGMGEENDSLIIESRKWAEERIEERMVELVAKADNKLQVANWDVLQGNMMQQDKVMRAGGALANLASKFK